MSRKRAKSKQKVVEAVPDEILAEGSGKVAAEAAGPVAEGAIAAAAEGSGEASIEASGGEPIEAEHETLAAAGDGSTAGADDEPVEAVLEASGDEALEAGGREPVDADDEALEAGHPSSAAGELEASVEALGAMEAMLAAAGGDVASDDAVSGDPAEAVAEDELAEDVAGAVMPTSAATMDALQLKHLVEALVFASDKPVTIQRLRQLTRVSEVRRLEQALAELTEDYKERGLIVQQVSGGYQFRTRTQFSAWVQQLIVGRPVRLSRAQLESLAIIAYRQPITRPEIDEIRGVDSSATLKLLMDRSLIRILGKREEVGRPMLYGTTREFLDFFSLGDLRELPTLREYSELTDESRKVMSDRLGVGLEPAAEPNVIFDQTGGEAVDLPGDLPVELDDVELRADDAQPPESDGPHETTHSDEDSDDVAHVGADEPSHADEGVHVDAHETIHGDEHLDDGAHVGGDEPSHDAEGVHVDAHETAHGDAHLDDGAHVGADEPSHADEGVHVDAHETVHGDAHPDDHAHVGGDEPSHAREDLHADAHEPHTDDGGPPAAHDGVDAVAHESLHTHEHADDGAHVGAGEPSHVDAHGPVHADAAGHSDAPTGVAGEHARVSGDGEGDGEGDADALASIASRVLAKADAADAAEAAAAAEAAETETEHVQAAMAELAAEAPSDAAGDPAAE